MLAAGAGVLAAAAVLTSCGSAPATSDPGTTDPTGVWVQVAAAPLSPREQATVVWTGREVLVFGGDTSPCPPTASCLNSTEVPPRDAAAYDPRTGQWHRIADLPGGLTFAGAVTAGGVVYALGGSIGSDPRVVAYDPDTDEWRDLHAPPGRPVRLTAVGDQLLAYPSSHRRDPEPDRLYDPHAGAWRELPPSPLGAGSDRVFVALDETRAVLLDVDLDAVGEYNGSAPPLYRAAVVDVRSGEWERLPDSPVLLSEASWHRVGGVVVNSTDGSYDGGGQWRGTFTAAGALDPSTGRWSSLPARPQDKAGAFGIGGGFSDVSGDGLVVDGRWVLHVADRSWEYLPDLPALDDVQGVASVWAGDRLFLWGGARFDEDHPGGLLLGDGWTWRPAAATPTAGTTDGPQLEPGLIYGRDADGGAATAPSGTPEAAGEATTTPAADHRPTADQLCGGQPKRATSWDGTDGVPRSELGSSFASHDDLFQQAWAPLTHRVTFEDDTNLDALVSDAGGQPVGVLSYMDGPVRWHLVTVVYC